MSINHDNKIFDLDPPAKKCFVSFLDLMGLNNLIETLGTAEAASKVAQFVFHTLLRLETSSDLKFCEELSVSIKHPEAILYKRKPNYILLSDSLILYSQNDDILDFLSLVYITRQALIVMFSSDMLIRGSIAYGDLCVQDDFNFIVGDALIKAYRLERIQNWFGVVIHKSCLERFGAENEDTFCVKILNAIDSKKNPLLVYFLKRYLPCWITKWDIPYKKEFSKGTKLAINWPSSLGIKPRCYYNCASHYVYPTENAKGNKKMLEDVEEKLENTKAFIRDNFNFCYEYNPRDL